LKVHKNETEISGLKEALLMESAALTSFYAQIKHNLGTKTFFEEEGEAMLHDLRTKYGQGLYLGPSFPAIIGSGGNGAIIHYRPKEG